MKINEFKIEGRRYRKRVGRGESSGYGKFAGRGNNGQRSRSGGSINPSFEGGQTSYFRRIPKHGFSNALFKDIFSTVNLVDIEKRYESGERVDKESLISKGLVRRKQLKVKILGVGELTKPLHFVVDKASGVAKEKILSSKGTIEELKRKVDSVK